LLAHALGVGFTDLAAEKGFRVQLARHQFQVQLDERDEFAHLGRSPRVAGHQCGLRVGGFEVVQDRLAFAQGAVFGANERDLAQRRRAQRGLVGPAGLDLLLGEGDALFQQSHLDFVVVVRDRESTQHEHRHLREVSKPAESTRRGRRALPHARQSRPWLPTFWTSCALAPI
jgi:hypothetical protein